MNRRFPTNLVTDAGVLADNAEQVANMVRRLAASVKTIVHEGKAVYDLLSPLVERLKSK